MFNPLSRWRFCHHVLQSHWVCIGPLLRRELEQCLHGPQAPSRPSGSQSPTQRSSPQPYWGLTHHYNQSRPKERERGDHVLCMRVYGMTMEMSCKRSCLTWSFTLIIQVTQLQSGSMTHLGGLTGSLESHTQSSAESVKLVQICLFYKNITRAWDCWLYLSTL